jgi:hypothetical protein
MSVDTPYAGMAVISALIGGFEGRLFFHGGHQLLNLLSAVGFCTGAFVLALIATRETPRR